MFEEDLLDEEAKKKKRRVLGLLFGLLLTGTAAVPLVAQLHPFSAMPLSEPTEAPPPTHTSVPVPAAADITATSSPEGTPHPTVSETAPAPTPAAITPSPSPPGPSQLPATGADAGQGLGRLIAGMAALLLGATMLGAGRALLTSHRRRLRATEESTPAPMSDKSLNASQRVGDDRAAAWTGEEGRYSGNARW